MKDRSWTRTATLGLATALATGVAVGQSAQNRNQQATDRQAQGAAQQQGTQQQAGAQQPALGPVVVVFPMQTTFDANLGNGCWVRFHDGKNFQGDQLTLVGPVDLPSMEGTGAPWGGWDSAIVGPNARVTTYDDNNYLDRSATLNANQRVADLGDSKLGFFEDIESVRVACTN